MKNVVLKKISLHVRDYENSKGIFNCSPVDVAIDSLTDHHSGRMNVCVNNVDFDCCLFKSDVKKLYVILSNLPQKGFARTSWVKFLDGFVLFIDDTTKNNALNALGPHHGIYFFYGDKNVDHHKLISDVVKKIAQENSIEYSNVFIIGHSNAGFAALSIANVIDGANAMAFNPQFSIPLHFKFFDKETPFEKFIGVSLSEHNDRYDVFNIVNNRTSRFFIYSNISSKLDKMQSTEFLERIGHPLEKGMLKINENIFYYVTEIDNKSPHGATPYESCLAPIENILTQNDSECVVQFSALMTDIERHYNETFGFWKRTDILQGELNILRYRAKLYKYYGQFKIKKDLERCFSLAHLNDKVKNFLLDSSQGLIFGAYHQTEVFYGFCGMFFKDIKCFCISDDDENETKYNALPIYKASVISDHIDISNYDLLICSDDMRNGLLKEELSKYSFKNIITVDSWEEVNKSLEAANKVFLSQLKVIR